MMATRLRLALSIALGLMVAQGLGRAAAPAPTPAPAFTLPAWCVPCRTDHEQGGRVPVSAVLAALAAK